MLFKFNAKIGNTSLLNRRKIGFLAGSKIAPLSVLPTLNWAAERGRCGIVCVLARSLYAKTPSEFLRAYTDWRVLFVSEEKQNRSSKESAYRRNRWA